MSKLDWRISHDGRDVICEWYRSDVWIHHMDLEHEVVVMVGLRLTMKSHMMILLRDMFSRMSSLMRLAFPILMV